MPLSARAILSGVLPVLVCLLVPGCGGDKTYRVSGKVTFKGQPIPAGKIYFTPDSSKGNSGPTGYADIKNGEYDTSSSDGKGVVGGPTIIAIEGIDPNEKPDKIDKSDKSGEVLVKSLFPRYETSADLPKSSSTKDIDVPAEATKGPVQKGPKVIVP